VDYSGDSNYALGELSWPTFTVAPGTATPSFVLTPPSPTPVPIGSGPLTIAVTLSGTLGTPTGSVKAVVDGTAYGAFVNLTNGSATFTSPGQIPTTVLTPGNHTVGVDYSGDSNYAALAPGSGPPNPISFVVTTVNTTTTITAPLNNGAAVFGQSVTLTAVVAPVAPGTGIPASSVQFFDGTASLGTVALDGAAHASLTLSGLTLGAHSFTAQYAGNATFNASTTASITAFTVGKASTSTSLAASGAILTATVTVNAPGAGSPTGTVTFQGPGGSLGSATLVASGGRFTATLTPASLTPGTYTATYSGDTDFNSSTSNAVSIASGPTTLTLTSSANPSTVGQSVTFTATISNPTAPGTPTGTVQFFDGSTLLGSATVATNSQAVFSTAALTAGSHAIVAKYSGDSTFTPSQATIGQVVNGMASTVTVTANPATATFGQTITLTATVGPSTPPTGFAAPTGQVIFQDNGNQIATVTLSSSEVATFTVNMLSVGTHTITAVYSGDTVWGSSHGSTTVTISALPPLLIINAAANISSSFAPDEAVSAFNVAILNGDTPATLPLQTTLAGVSVAVKDSAGVTRQALIYGVFASTNQVNFVFPSNTALGSATVTITVPTGPKLSTTVNITRVSPGIFAANMNGQGVFAGQVVHVHADGSREVDSSATFDSGAKTYVANPVNLGPSTDQVFLQIYGTGLQHASSVTVTINGGTVPSVFAAQGQYPGLDQVNVQVSNSLAGAGVVNIVVTADGQAANTVTVTIQ
jgi:uncharacterized protein (TIGR03437 family)